MGGLVHIVVGIEVDKVVDNGVGIEVVVRNFGVVVDMAVMELAPGVACSEVLR